MEHVATMINPNLPLRCAAYLRYSSKMQRAVSLDIQEGICRAKAESIGGVLLEEWIGRDAAQSAKRSKQRPALQRLLEAARMKNRPFDVLMFDDTSRLARNTSAALKAVESLIFAGVRVIFAYQGVDSADAAGFKLALTVHALMDEQQNVRHGYKVREGMKTAVRRGFITGSKLFGYDNVRECEPGVHQGRSGLTGVRKVVNEEEASIVRRIFESYANGRGVHQIAMDLNRDRIPAPRRAKDKARRLGPWSERTIRKMIENETFHGQVVWDKTKSLVNPDTDAIVIKQKPEEEWLRVSHEALRIVSEELWNRVQMQRTVFAKKFERRRQGGLNRAANKPYLFSGIMSCGICGQSMVIVGGKGDDARYGCKIARYETGACSNKLLIKQSSLSSQMLDVFSNVWLKPANVHRLVREVYLAAERLRQEREDAALDGTLHRLELQHSKETARVNDLADFLFRTSNRSEALAKRLAEAEANATRLAADIAAFTKPPVLAFTEDDVREVLKASLSDLLALASTDVHQAKSVLRRYVRRLMLIPQIRAGEKFYEVLGEVDLFESATDKAGVMLDNAVVRFVQHYKNRALAFYGPAISAGMRKAA